MPIVRWTDTYASNDRFVPLPLPIVKGKGAIRKILVRICCYRATNHRIGHTVYRVPNPVLSLEEHILARQLCLFDNGNRTGIDVSAKIRFERIACRGSHRL